MRRVPPVLLACALALSMQTLASATPYSVEIIRPPSPDDVARVRGRVLLRVQVDGLGQPSNVAYHLSEPGVGWSEQDAVAMSPAGGGVYEAGFESVPVPNGTYRVRVRAWGGSAGAYDPADDGTYAADGIALEVANPPPPPASVVVEGGAGTLEVSWDELATATRSDFAGYEVYLALADATGSCPAFGDVYSLRQTTFGTRHTEGGLASARYCVAVRALRSAPGGPIGSSAADPARVDVSEGDGDVGDPDPALSGGAYTPGLPYTPGADSSPVTGGEVTGTEALEAGTREGRNRWAIGAAGLVLAILALLLGRYVRAAPDR